MRHFGLAVTLIAGLNLSIINAALGQKTEDRNVDALLILAIDTSASVDTIEYWTQIDGIAEAINHPDVLELIEIGYYGAVAISVIEWSGFDSIKVSIPWTRISNQKDADTLNDKILKLDRYILSGKTSISGLLMYAKSHFENASFRAERWVLDVAGDGKNNDGPTLDAARNVMAHYGITVNGLAILTDFPELDQYFQDNLIVGPSAFVEVANSYKEFPAAIRRKLIRELTAKPIS